MEIMCVRLYIWCIENTAVTQIQIEFHILCVCVCVVATSAVDFIIFIFHGGGSGGVKLRYYLQGNKGASALESWQDLLGRDEGM